MNRLFFRRLLRDKLYSFPINRLNQSIRSLYMLYLDLDETVIVANQNRKRIHLIEYSIFAKTTEEIKMGLLN